MSEGFIDLGKKQGTGAIDMPSKDTVHYPTVFISHDSKDSSGLEDLPDGDFEFTAKGRVLSHKVNNKTGTCECEIEIKAIKPSTKKAKKVATSEDSLDSAFNDIIKKKPGKKSTIVMADEAEPIDNPVEEAAKND